MAPLLQTQVSLPQAGPKLPAHNHFHTLKSLLSSWDCSDGRCSWLLFIFLIGRDSQLPLAVQVHVWPGSHSPAPSILDTQCLYPVKPPERTRSAPYHHSSQQGTRGPKEPSHSICCSLDICQGPHFLLSGMEQGCGSWWLLPCTDSRENSAKGRDFSKEEQLGYQEG